VSLKGSSTDRRERGVRGTIDRERINDTSVSQAFQPLSNPIITHIKGIVRIQIRVRSALSWRSSDRGNKRPRRMIHTKISKRILSFLNSLLGERRRRL
jgi:hypothetical protein